MCSPVASMSYCGFFGATGKLTRSSDFLFSARRPFLESMGRFTCSAVVDPYEVPNLTRGEDGAQRVSEWRGAHNCLHGGISQLVLPLSHWSDRPTRPHSLTPPPLSLSLSGRQLTFP